MRKIAKSGQISMPSLIEIRRGLRDEGERYGDRYDIQIPNKRGNWRRPTAAYILNWLGCYLLTRPEAERDRIISEGRAVFEQHAASDTPIAFGREVPADSGTITIPPGLGATSDVDRVDGTQDVGGDRQPARKKRRRPAPNGPA